jgi:hypothetical protein
MSPARRIRSLASAMVPALLLLALAVPPARAAGLRAVLGGNGELYRLLSGPHGQLLPGQSGAAAENPVLVLEIVRASGTVRTAVPETLGDDRETAAALVFEDASNSLFLLWEAQVNALNRVLRIARFDGERWAPTIDLSSHEFADKTAAQLHVTRDSYTETDADGNTVKHIRTVLHVVWNEVGSGGLRETFYSPVVLEDGVYVGQNSIFRLNGRDTSPPAATGYALPENLLVAPRLQPGHDEQSAHVAFTDEGTRRLVVLEVQALPAQLARIADGARAHFIGVGSRYDPKDPKDVNRLAEEVRAYVLRYAKDFQPEVAAALAAAIGDYVLANAGAGGNLTNIADGARAHFIGVGARLINRGMVSGRERQVGANEQVVEVPGDAERAHLLLFKVVFSRPAPRIGAGAVTIHASASGDDVLIAWREGDVIGYRDTTTGVWGPSYELRLGDGLDLAAAEQILQQRIRNR